MHAIPQSPYFERALRTRAAPQLPTVLLPARSAGGDGAFTRYLRSLEADGEPPPEAFQGLWRSLRSAVVAELRRRAAWTSPPSYYGVYGWESWQAHHRGPGCTGSALDELITDCFTFVFVERLPRLRAQLATKPQVDGLVVLYLRNYLHDRRKHHDLLGFHVFEGLRLAVRQAVDAGELWVVAGDGKVTNGTVLAASEDVDPADAAQAVTLRPHVQGWTHELLPDFFTAAGPRRPEVVLRLQRLLLGLAAGEAGVFRFKDVADELKRSLRASWAAVFDFAEGEAAEEDATPGFAAVARRVPPGKDLEERESFDELVTCVARRLEVRTQPEQTRRQLRHLWGFLRVWAQSTDSEKLPSSRQLGKLLDIPRKRLPSLWTVLRHMVRACVGAPDGEERS